MSMHYFAKNLHTLRINHGYTQLQMSQLLNIERQSYGNYEHGIRTPDLNTLLRIAEIFHVSLDTLVSDSQMDQQLARIISYYESVNSLTQKEIADFVAFKASISSI
ncbi:MAG: helix-turn-helix transcriptional regulator [Lachnospiraceae bacterium]|nr:helix-turn-helix transcriptional regulator [Lachnospiraceae bacterium]